MFEDISWNEIQFTDDLTFQWEEVIWDEPEEVSDWWARDLTEAEREAFASVPFDDDDAGWNPIDSYPRDELRGPFVNYEDAMNYASNIHGASTEIVYDTDDDVWYVWVGESR